MLCSIILAGVLGGLSGDSAERQPEALTVDGSRFSAQLLSIDKAWNLGLSTDGEQPRVISVQKLVTWGQVQTPSRGEFVLLSDGSLLVADVVEIGERQITINNDVWGEVSLSRQLVRGVVWQPPVRRIERTRLIDRVRDSSVGEDELTLQNGDVIRGRLTHAGDGSAQFATTAPLELSLDQIVAWIQRKEETADPASSHAEHAGPLRVLIGLRDGSMLIAKSAVLGESLSIQLPGGIQLASQPIVRPVAEQVVAFVQPLHGSVTYLSDLQPLGYKHVPFLSIPWSWRADRNVLGGPLSAGDQVFAKGLGMHSTSRLAYDLPRTYQRFDAEIAIDQSAGQGGSVVFRVFTDVGDRSWQEAYKSPVIRGGDQPRSISVDISEARRVALVVDFADRGDQLDYADWLNPRLVSIE